MIPPDLRQIEKPKQPNTAMQTRSGVMIHLDNPDARKIRIEDIAHGLSQICRFTGHTDKFYSVAQHSVFVSQMCPAKYALQGLMHDAHEAYIGDLATPLKQLLEDASGGRYGAMRKAFDSAIRIGLTLPPMTERAIEIVKAKDELALVYERHSLGLSGNDDLWPTYGVHELTVKRIAELTPVKPVGPTVAKEMFMERYLSLRSFDTE